MTAQRCKDVGVQRSVSRFDWRHIFLRSEEWPAFAPLLCGEVKIQARIRRILVHDILPIMSFSEVIFFRIRNRTC